MGSRRSVQKKKRKKKKRELVVQKYDPYDFIGEA